MVQTKRQKTKTTIIITALILVLLVGGGLGAWLLKRDSDSNQEPVTPVTIDETINLDPPTEEEQREADQNRDALAQKLNEQNGSQQPESPNLDGVQPAITYAGQFGGNIEAAGFVSSVFEDGGSCLYTFSRGSQQINRQTSGFQDVSHTTCTPVSIPRSEFPEAGLWSLTLTYTSTSATGASDAQSLEVQ